MRRLFSTFARGAPGAGLLLIRVAFGIDLLFQAVADLTRESGLEADLLDALPAVLGLLLLAGLWTPIAGVLVAIYSLVHAFAQPSDAWRSLLLGSVGVAIALLGPGAWSIDARLYGWKRIELRDR